MIGGTISLSRIRRTPNSNLFGTVSQASAQTLLDETQAAIDALEGWGATTMVAAPGQSDES